MKIRPMSDFPRQLQQIIRNLDQADVLLTTLLIDGNRDDDATNFSMPLHDVVTYIEMVHGFLISSLDIVSECGPN
jgi:hypothetical protein